jgi:hypothetical protein
LYLYRQRYFSPHRGGGTGRKFVYKHTSKPFMAVSAECPSQNGRIFLNTRNFKFVVLKFDILPSLF